MSSSPADPDRTLIVDSDTTFRQTPFPAGQYAPGTVVAGRYHIAGALGRGGMGEVYRAEDAKLGQTVALKFLPPALARDPVLLARLHDEVRLGRQVAHPNVCRIYDIGEWGEAHFLAMEYVDGEDLARLLRRIGRLPHDKAVDIIRGLASGLAAAHAKGIIHRDLKPANVMIDGDGQARITDFGLALGAGETDGSPTAGTPAYMAPEQLEGQPASIRSDLYALGLVMYELFTGRHAYRGATLPELRYARMSEAEPPSSVIADIDPAVERLILRCLEKDPTLRPASAREVLEALPGGDPIAAAIRAGETPSPRAIAAASVEGRLSPKAAWSWLGVLTLFTVVSLVFASDVLLVARVPLHLSPPVLEAKARDVLQAIGVPQQPQHAIGFESKRDYVAWIVQHDRSPYRFRRLAAGPPGMTFWMRQSAQPLTPSDSVSPTRSNPPDTGDSMTTIELDPRGRLVSLLSHASAPARPPDWRPLLVTAGLDPATLTPAAPQRIPPLFADARAAWTGRHPDDGTPIRIEAAAQGGVPNFFVITAPWDAAKGAARQLPFGSSALTMFVTVVIAGLVVLALLLGVQNLRFRRGDRQGTLRLGLFVLLVSMGGSILLADHRLSFLHELRLMTHAAQGALFWAAIYMALYAALEPYARRRWPDRLVSWSRLLRGSHRDPMVGRDLLIGMTAGVAHATLAYAGYWLPPRLGVGPEGPLRGAFLQPLFGARFAVGDLAARAVAGSMLASLASVVALVVLTILLRRRSFAAAGFFTLMMTGFLLATRDPLLIPFTLTIAVMLTWLLVRVGFLAYSAMYVTFELAFGSPLALMPDAWNAASFAVPLIFLAAVAIYAFRTALGGQSAFGSGLLDG